VHVKPSYSVSHRCWAVPGDSQKGGWPSLRLGIINGRVAERQIAEQVYIFTTPKYQTVLVNTPWYEHKCVKPRKYCSVWVKRSYKTLDASPSFLCLLLSEAEACGLYNGQFLYIYSRHLVHIFCLLCSSIDYMFFFTITCCVPHGAHWPCQIWQLLFLMSLSADWIAGLIHTNERS
jgi:hypothetical protein